MSNLFSIQERNSNSLQEKCNNGEEEGTIERRKAKVKQPICVSIFINF